MATIESLAPELLILIQRMLDSLRDLHSLIAALPTCFRTFRLNRTQILSSVVVNGIQPGALRHAVAICHAPPPPTTRSRQRKRRRRDPDIPLNPLEPFLDKYFSDAAFDIPTDISDLASLCRLQSLVSRFVREYFLRATGLLRTAKILTPGDSDLPDELFPPSPSELTRLQRAFFRHELYSRIFPVQRDLYYNGSATTSVDQFRLFIARLEPWEAEEMTCVHSYLMHMAGRGVEDLEDRVVQAVLASPGVQRPCKSRLSPPDSQKNHFENRFEARSARLRKLKENVSADPPAHPPLPTDATPNGNSLGGGSHGPAHSGERMVAFDDLESWGLDLFDTYRQRSLPSDISNLASLGFELFRRLVNGDDEQRRTMIQKHMSYPRHFLGDALRHSPPQDSHLSRIRAEGAGSDDPAQASVGYRLFRRHGGLVYDQVYDHTRNLIYKNNPLRERGYVFWDAARIDDGVARLSLEEARDPSNEAVGKVSWLSRISVEERLQGVRMPLSLKERIAREFGYPKWFDAEYNDDDDDDDE